MKARHRTALTLAEARNQAEQAVNAIVNIMERGFQAIRADGVQS